MGGRILGIYEKERLPQITDHMGKEMYYHSGIFYTNGLAPKGRVYSIVEGVRQRCPLTPIVYLDSGRTSQAPRRRALKDY